MGEEGLSTSCGAGMSPSCAAYHGKPASKNRMNGCEG
jgi:hypothetical protein